jgi:hypothetical protein
MTKRETTLLVVDLGTKSRNPFTAIGHSGAAAITTPLS